MRRYTVRDLILASDTLGIVGAFLYVIAQLFKADWKSRTSILIRKALLGIGAGGGQSIQHSYLAEILTPSLLAPAAEILN